MAARSKSKASDAKKKLAVKQINAWDALTAREAKDVERFAGDYKAFLDAAKTEREAVRTIAGLAADAGFGSPTAKGKADRFVWTHRNKNAAVAVRGAGRLEDGVKILVAHVDSPRLDLKPNPLYEELGIGLAKTHYYGGIRKHQWVARALALHGTVMRADGTAVDIVIGEADDDPVFVVNDLLPHLAANAQAGKKLSEAIPGEKLNIVVGSRPEGAKDESDRVKLALLQILNKRYGIVEEDFVSAELEAVPAGRARDVGLDRSMIGAYGHDDRVCVYTALRAVLDAGKAAGTTIALFLDKEEIGSEGNTGAQSRFLLDVVGDLLARDGIDSERAIRRTLAASACLSADVNAAIDPDWQSVHDPRNAGRLGGGVCLTKFTGVRGKAGASDASAEFVGRVRKVFSDAKVCWHAAELGKVDEGGGGTIAKFFALHGMDVLDVGTCVLSMHAPMEIVGKADVYMTYKGFRAFVERF